MTVSQTVLVDSGPLLALFNRNDTWHTPVVAWLKTHPHSVLVSTWPVLTEVCALLARRVHHQAALDFLWWIEQGALHVDIPMENSLSDIRSIAQRFSNLPLDLADASIAEAAQRSGLRYILSIDTDFDVYRDRQGQLLINLLQK